MGETRCYPAAWGLPHVGTTVSAEQDLIMADYGDAPVDPLSAERSMEPIRALVREVPEIGTIPFIVGGDHSLMYSDVAALADIYGKGRVGVVHFDAHYDAGSDGFGHHISDRPQVEQHVHPFGFEAENRG